MEGMLSRQGPHWPASPRLLCIMHLAICLRGRAGACSNGIFGAPFVSDMVSSMPPAPHLVHRRCPFAGNHAHRPLCPSPTAAVRIMHIIPIMRITPIMPIIRIMSDTPTCLSRHHVCLSRPSCASCLSRHHPSQPPLRLCCDGHD